MPFRIKKHVLCGPETLFVVRETVAGQVIENKGRLVAVAGQLLVPLRDKSLKTKATAGVAA
jgi:hypothetical protein